MPFLLLVPLVFIVMFVLPIVTLVRMTGIARRLEATEKRLRDLERTIKRPAETVATGASEAAGVAPQPAVAAERPAAPAPRPIAPPVVAAPPEPTRTFRQPPPEPSLRTQPTSDTLEAEIGSRWMLVVGTIVLVLGVAFFVKYSFDRHWISVPVRIAAGTAAGILVWIAGLYFTRRGYALYGQIVAGGGLAMVYVSAYAAHALYGLVPATPAFVWMAATSAATAATADRQRAVGLALLAIAFGFAVPFLVASRGDHHITLFVFDATLIAATLALVRRHGWPLLSVTCFALAALSFVAWAGLFYTPDKFVSTETYLTVACAMFLAMRREHEEARDTLTQLLPEILWLAPAMYHVASVAVLFDHSLPFLVYLIVVTMIAVASTAVRSRAPLRLLAWGAVALPFFAWIPIHAAGSWYVATLATAAAIYFLHLFGQFEALTEGGEPPDAEVALFHANGLGLFAFTYAAVNAHGDSPSALAFLLAAWNALLAFQSRERASGILPHALALAFTFTAIGVALALTGPWITVAWAAEGAAVIWTGFVTRRSGLRFGGIMLLALAVIRLVTLQFGQTFVSFVPLLNSRTAVGAFIVALMYGLATLYKHYRDVAPAEARHWVDVWLVSANVLTIALLTADIYSFWTVHDDWFIARFARELTISLTWTVYGLALITIGFQRRLTSIRYLALVLFGVTVSKVFTVDLLELDGIYRITGFIVLGLVLLGASFLYQRFRQRLSDGYASS